MDKHLFDVSKNDRKIFLIVKYNKHYIKLSKMKEIHSSFTKNKSKCANPPQTVIYASLKLILWQLWKFFEVLHQYQHEPKVLDFTTTAALETQFYFSLLNKMSI